MKTSEFLQKLQKVKRTQNGWNALCPSHNDKQRSLSVKESDSKILLKCFAGCDTKGIVSALGLEMKDLFEPSNGFHSNGKQQPKRIVATYDYTDENGELLFQSVRYEPKDFRQRRQGGEGDFIWNLENTRLVLYRLPEILVSPMVYLVEGEKDVETLRENDLVATCNPMGAGKWRNEYNEFLQDKTIIILPDNDEPGRKHALQVANSLRGIAKEIVILQLPNLQPKGDVTDYFQNGGTVDELIDLVARAEAWQPNGEETEGGNQVNDAYCSSLFIVKSANAWIEEAKLKPMPKMLFDEFWLEGEVCILFGDTGKGKTALAVQINDAISSGIGVKNFNLEAVKQTVLYFDFELSAKQFEKRYAVRQDDVFTNHYKFDENFKRVEINRYAGIPKRFRDFESYLLYSLEAEINNTEAKILTVDNITYLKTGTETAKDALPLMKELTNLKMKYDLSLMALAHTPKRDLSKPITINDLQGSKMLSIFADSIFAVGESAKDKNLRYLKQIKVRSGECIFDSENVAVCQLTKPDNFLMFEILSYGSEREHLKQMTEGDKKELIEKVKNLSALGESQRKIASELGISLTSVNRYLRK